MKLAKKTLAWLVIALAGIVVALFVALAFRVMELIEPTMPKLWGAIVGATVYFGISLAAKEFRGRK